MMAAVHEAKARFGSHYDESGTSRAEAHCVATERDTSALPPDTQRGQ